ncbi:hypothetical protein AB1Y20_008375 [Prymnesium parvum]|uniref:Uncharacterized protein n=1 Tax=Prymnesium parvum TaxID=97485 RepID=A0AB34IR14_PRYPA
MPSKESPQPFEVDGVACTIGKGGLVNVAAAVDVDTRDFKVRCHPKFSRLAARARAGQPEVDEPAAEHAPALASQCTLIIDSTVTMEAEADQLKPNMVVAVRATNGAEWQSEGPVWLLHIDSEAFEVSVLITCIVVGSSIEGVL